jgi:hypothetical protein
MTRQVLIVVGVALLFVGGMGIITGMAWLTVSYIHGTLPQLYDKRAEMLVYTLPVVLLAVAIAGAAFVAGALAAPTKEERAARHLRLRLHLHS